MTTIERAGAEPPPTARERQTPRGGDALAVLRSTRLSVLDRSLTRAGRPAGEALRETVAFARQVEELGYHRFWVSEHHGVPGVAGAAPTVLAAAVAAATDRIRVGTAGVMLPNHAPLLVAEQFGVLESLYPGRIDMGLGRSVGFTGAVRRALGVEKEAADGFEEQLRTLLGYFTPGGPVRAVPAEGLRVPAHVLATGAGADIAARLGLPLILGGPDPAALAATAERYRAAFRPGPQAARPRVTVAVNAAVGADAQQAALLQLPEAWATTDSRIRGVFTPLLPPGEVRDKAMDARELRYFREARRSQLHGTAEQVVAALAGLVTATGAAELLLTLNTHDPADRLASYRRLASVTTPATAPSSSRS